jgi:alkyldihydroxyacetonephosphate synthase
VSRIALDRVSLLADVAADVTVSDLEAHLAREGLTLGLGALPDVSLGAFLARGAAEAAPPWDDPADHLVAGFTARNVGTGEHLVVRAAPRRSTGPDLFALVAGMNERYFVLERATVRVHLADAPRVALPFASAKPPPACDVELALLARLGDELSKGTS